MVHSRENLVRQMRNVLEGAAVNDTERVRIVGELHARVRRLRNANPAMAEVRLSRQVQSLLPTVLSA